jgi:hypothetical protein
MINKEQQNQIKNKILFVRDFFSRSPMALVGHPSPLFGTALAVPYLRGVLE